MIKELWWAKEPEGINPDNAVILFEEKDGKTKTYHLEVNTLGRYIRQIKSGYILENEEDISTWTPLEQINLLKMLNYERLGDVFINGDVLVHVGESAISGDSYVIPEGIREIGSKCFYNMRSLKKVYIPNTVKYIRSSGFNGSGVEELILPESVCGIGSSAFCNCFDLKWIECANTDVHSCLRTDQIRNTPRLVEIILVGQPRMADPYQNKEQEKRNTCETTEEAVSVAEKVREAVSNEVKNLKADSSVINLTVNCYFSENSKKAV